jgi:hypothetical protein
MLVVFSKKYITLSESSTLTRSILFQHPTSYSEGEMEEVVVFALLCLFAMGRAGEYIATRYDRILCLLEEGGGRDDDGFDDDK